MLISFFIWIAILILSLWSEIKALLSNYNSWLVSFFTDFFFFFCHVFYYSKIHITKIYYLDHFSVLTGFYRISFTGTKKTHYFPLDFIFTSNNKAVDLFLSDIFLQSVSSSPPLLPGDEVNTAPCLVDSAGKLPRKKKNSAF